jgi:hypothetical protein
MPQYTIDDVPECFPPVLERIEDLFNATAVIDDFDDEWLHFHIPGLADRYAVLKIEAKHDVVLPGSDLQNYQILCASTNSGGKGLWIHSLADSSDGDDYLSGVWFF